MNDKEMISNLGTIARSGSKLFVQQINESLSSDNESELESRNSNTYMNNAEAIIGQFGVGFYSVFMVCDKVEVYSNPCALEDEFEFDDNDTNTNNDNINTGYYWTSDGSGDYSIARASNVLRGTKIIVHLKKEARKEFCDKYRIEGIIKKYSSYLEFPIKLNGSLITSTGAIWQKKPSEVTKIQYKDFFQLLSDRYDDPYYIYHSHFDSSKFSAQCLIYFPETHEERFGSKRLQPGINLYCRKVLVQRNCKDIIPDWLRFVKGVIDSENIPIHISRENMQDSVLIKQLQESIMMKIVDFLKRQSSKDEKRYLKWYEDYKGFLKEGVCSDYHNRSRIAKLLRFETNIKNENELMSLDDYIDDLEERKEAAGTGGDKKASASDIKDEIYYLVAPTRETALNSPYIEAFQNRNIPVFLCYAQIDEFVMKVLGSYRGKEIIGIESSTTSVKHEFKNKKGSNKDKDNDPPLTKDDCRRLGKWMRKEFPKLVESCEITYRLDSHPAVFVDHQAQSLRHYLKAANEETKLPPQRMQVNPNHNIIKGLYREIQENNEDKAKLLCKQLINNACIAAGIIDDARNMLADLNLVMEMALGYDPTDSNADTNENENENENDNSDNTQDTDSEETIEARKAAKKAQDEKDSFESQYQTLQ